MPFVLAELAALDDGRLDLACRRCCRRAARRRPSASSSRSPGRTLAREPGERRRDTARAADEVAGRDRAACRPASARIGRAAFERAGADLRTAEVLEDRRPRAGRARAAARTRANVAACDSCVPCEKFSRKMSVPAAISASSIVVGIAGRTDGRDDLRVAHRIGSVRSFLASYRILNPNRLEYPMGQIVPDAVERYLAALNRAQRCRAR